ncbi:hypothetical protein [Vibrio scophthalmi]|uniref:Lipoprotein n=1 Tax=Vibrio scophthalmi TaxID=45658 RepID=A0A1E3WIP7_9VIBR|nr:hypothetical protein [Vibrio scophthalmi]ODS09618.1 hypothetical protein VSF3289_03282 [Vibrio scophthalmi]
MKKTLTVTLISLGLMACKTLPEPQEPQAVAPEIETRTVLEMCKQYRSTTDYKVIGKQITLNVIVSKHYDNGEIWGTDLDLWNNNPQPWIENRKELEANDYWVEGFAFDGQYHDNDIIEITGIIGERTQLDKMMTCRIEFDPRHPTTTKLVGKYEPKN